MKRIIFLFALFLMAGMSLEAQYKSKSNLVIDDKSGNLVYSYQIQNRTMAGHPISVGLNYSSNVLTTSFCSPVSSGINTAWAQLKRSQPAWILGVNGFAVQVLGQSFCFGSWGKEITNRVLNSEHQYDENGNLSSVTMTIPHLKNEHNTVWLIDGYDYCNRIKPLTDPDNQDIIKLLRSDGSLLELRNPTQKKHVGDINDPALYTGHYYEKGIGTQGYAIVKFIPNNELPAYVSKAVEGLDNPNSRRPRVIHYFPGDGLEYIFKEDIFPYGTRVEELSGLHETSIGWKSGTDIVAPNNDPYDWDIVNWVKDAVGAAVNKVEYPDFAHTIFYLESISIAEKKLVNVQWAMEESIEDGKVFRGRRPVSSFADVTIFPSLGATKLPADFMDHPVTESSNDNFYTIETLDKTLFLPFKKKYNVNYMDSGDEGEISYFGNTPHYGFNIYDNYYDELDGYNSAVKNYESLVSRVASTIEKHWQIDASTVTDPYKEKYIPFLHYFKMSELHYITGIYESAKRMLTFDYKFDSLYYSSTHYEDPSSGFPFPYQFDNQFPSTSPNKYFGLRRVRLKSIDEPTHKYEITYHKGDDEVDVDSLSMQNDFDSFSTINTLKTYSKLRNKYKFVSESKWNYFSNITFDDLADELNVGTILNSGSPLGENSFIKAVIKENKTFNPDKRTLSAAAYKQYEVANPLTMPGFSLEGNKYQIQVPVVNISIDSTVINQVYNEYSIFSSNFVLPVKTLKRLAIRGGLITHDKVTGYVEYDYEFEDVIDYVGSGEFADHTINTHHGRRLLSSTATVMDPSKEPYTELYSTKSYFKNMRYDFEFDYYQNESLKDRKLSKAESYKNALLKKLVPSAIPQEEQGAIITKRLAPAYFGLLEKKFIKAGEKVLSGVWHRYVGELSGYSSALPFGSLRETYRVPEAANETEAIQLSEKVATYDYWRASNLPDFDFSYGNLKSVTDANGATTTLYYDKRYSETQSDAKIMYNDESHATQYNWYSDLDYQMPIAAITDVRSSHGSSTLDSKTMYDEYGNVRGITDQNGWLTWHEYDRLGRITKVTQPYDFTKDFKMLNILSENCVKLPDRETKVEVEKDEWLLYEEEIARRMAEKYTVDYSEELVASNVQPRFNYLDQAPKQEGSVLNLKSKISLTYIPWTDDKLQTATQIDAAHLKLNCVIGGNPYANILTLDIPQLNFTKNIVINNPSWIKPVGNCSQQLEHYEDATPLEVRFDVTDVINEIKFLNEPVTMLISTPTLDASVKALDKSEDSEPCLEVKGNYGVSTGDFTYAFEYDDLSFETKVISKLDDNKHFSHFNGQNFQKNLLDYRLNGAHYTDFDGRYIAMMNKNISSNEVETVFISQPALTSGTTLNTKLLDGIGRVISSTNIYGQTTSFDYSNSNVPNPTYKTLGTAITLPEDNNNETHTLTKTVKYCDPTHVNLEGLSVTEFDNFYGLAIIAETQMEGVSSKKFYNALGQLLYSIDNEKLTTYIYDEYARLKKIEKPGDTYSKVWYDEFGNVTNKFSKEKGVISVVTNKMNQVRFSQNEKQSKEHKLSFNQYDDLGRKTLVGEAEFSATALPYVPISETDVNNDLVFGKRAVDNLDADYLHYEGSENFPPTVNNTVYQSTQGWINLDRHNTLDESFISSFNTSTAYLDPQSGHGDIDINILGFINSSYIVANPLSNSGASATLDNFEDVNLFPNFVLQTIAYDQLPKLDGSIWGGMPDMMIFNKILEGVAPNIKGNVSAIAYRDSKEDDFSYVVIRYDARSRVKAFVRYTPDNGFDAVHYAYNSANKVTAIHAFDGNTSYVTWYGYNSIGQLEKVWSHMYQAKDNLVSPDFIGLKMDYTGLWVADNLKPIMEMIDGLSIDLVNDLDITYNYNSKYALESKEFAYHNQNLTVNYGYNIQGILSTITAFDPNGVQLFKDDVKLRDNFGRIKEIGSEYSSSLLAGFQNTIDNFDYDNQGRLTEWSMHKAGQVVNYKDYNYDAVGNFTSVVDNQVAHDQYTYTYSGSNANNLYGASRLTKFEHYDGYDEFSYDVLGNTTQRHKYDDSGQLIGKDEFIYNPSGMIRKTISDVDGNNNKWIFSKKYSIFGGVQSQSMESAAESVALTYDHNLLGAGGETIVRYHGLVDQTSPGNELAYIYPYEMLVNGGEVTKRFDGTRSISVSGMRGNIRLTAEIDQNGAATYSCYEYTPFGKQIGTYALSAQNLGFGGKRKEMKSNYYQLGARTYDPDMGRFLQQDPLFEMFTGHSSYSYAFNNPVMFGDPSGLAPEPIQKGGGTGDVLLGNMYSLDKLMGSYSTSVTPLIEYRTDWTTQYWVRLDIYDKDLCKYGYGWNHPDKTKTIKFSFFSTSSGTTSSYTPAAASMVAAGPGGGGGGSGSSGNDNGSTDFGYWDDSNINPEGWANMNNEFIGTWENLEYRDQVLPLDNYEVNNVILVPREGGRDFTNGQKGYIEAAMNFLKGSSTFSAMYDYIVSTTIPVMITPLVNEIGKNAAVWAETGENSNEVDRIFLGVNFVEIFDNIDGAEHLSTVIISIASSLAHEFTHIYDLLIPYGENPSVLKNDHRQRDEKILYPNCWICRPSERKAEYYRGVIMKELGY